MTPSKAAPDGRRRRGATRRSFLTGLGTLSLASVGELATRTARGGSRKAATGEDGPFTDPAVLEAFVDSVMERHIGTEAPGASIAIVRGDTPVLTRGYGVADVDAATPVRADETTFRVGSVGKLVTWTAVLQGVEQGLLDLDENVDAYLDDSEVSVPDTDDGAVTLRHLGTHTAGFESALDPRVVARSAALVPLETVLAENPPSRVRPPGERVGYSNYGAALAGHVVAEVRDTTFEEYVQSEIFAPLNMTHSTFAQPVPKRHPGRLASGHTQDGTAFTVADDAYINMYPAGSMSATATDMAAFMSALLGGGAVGPSRVLNPETVRTMYRQQHVRHPAVTNWRYGVHEYGHPDANVLSHSGGTINFRSRLVLVPDQDVGIFVNYNSNSPNGAPASVVDEILAEYDLQPSPSVPTPTTKPGGQERAESVAGEYRSTSLPQSGPLQVAELLARVSVEAAGDGRLVTETLEGPRRQWVETEPYVYHETSGHDRLAFDVAAGEVEAMYMSSDPTGAHLPVPLHERQLVAGGLLGATLSGFGLSLVGWTVGGTYRRLKRRRTDRTDDTE